MAADMGGKEREVGMVGERLQGGREASHASCTSSPHLHIYHQVGRVQYIHGEPRAQAHKGA